MAGQINPRFAEGDLVRITSTRNQAEGKFVQRLLLEEGVPSILRRAPGLDAPELLATTPRDVLVPASAAQVARDVLLQAGLAWQPPGG